MFTLVADALHLPRPKNGVIIPISSSSSDHLDMEYPYLSASDEGIEPSLSGSEPGVLPLYEPESLPKSTISHPHDILVDYNILQFLLFQTPRPYKHYNYIDVLVHLLRYSYGILSLI